MPGQWPCRRTHIGLALAAAVTLAACEAVEEPVVETGRPILAAAVVSNPATQPASGGLAPGVSRSLVYVSLPPGSLPGSEQATLTNRRTGAMHAVTMAEGGFDPVAVDANAGDTLTLDVGETGGGSPPFAMVVPERRAPVVVRTDPPMGMMDVLPDPVMLVVFSEPIDAGTLTAASVQLSLNGAPIASTRAFANPARFTLAITPDAPLAGNVEYTLRITPEVADLDGDPLEALIVANFTTAQHPPPNLAPSIAFVSTRSGTHEIYVADADGSSVRRLATGSNPAWTWDGERIAFDRAGAVRVINADGSGERWLADGFTPSWSPDDRKVVFASPSGISVLSLDSALSAPALLLSSEFANPGVPSDYSVNWPVWSPDGQKIAFVRANYVEGFQGWVMSADGSNPRPIGGTEAASDLEKLYPKWSPDGTRIAFTSHDWTDGGPPHVWVLASLDAGGTGSRAIHFRALEYQYAGEADWSPDLRTMAFTMQTPAPTAPEPGPQRIFEVDLYSGAVRQLIPDAERPVRSDYRDYAVAWSRSSRTARTAGRR